MGSQRWRILLDWRPASVAEQRCAVIRGSSKQELHLARFRYPPAMPYCFRMLLESLSTIKQPEESNQSDSWTPGQPNSVDRHCSLKGATNTARSFSIPFTPNQCVYSTNFLTGAMNISNRGYPDAAAYAGEVPFVSKDSPGGLKGTSVACPIFAGVVSLLNDLRCHSP